LRPRKNFGWALSAVLGSTSSCKWYTVWSCIQIVFISGFDGSDFAPWQLGLKGIATEFNGNYSLEFSVYCHQLRWDIMISLSRRGLAGNY
jgi:hypothetical protein